jgi:hypothetical protein
MRRLAVALVFVLAAASTGAEPEKPAVSAADREFFEAKVRPVLVQRCYGCHSAAARKLRGGLRLDSPAGLRKGSTSGSVIDPTKPDQSLLLRVLRREGDLPQMPPSGALPEREIAVLAEWVRRKAPMPESAAGGKALSLEEGRRFWSFRPLAAQLVPAVKASAWPRTRTDAFLLAALQSHGLGPSPEADRRTLIRRLSFDLIGLPPSPSEVEAFVADPEPLAYERLVDRLLASPHHGERWGRFWLDLARYADVTEQWSDCKGAAWLYRDWVVRAVQTDLPYDQFLQRQLAADLMPDTTPADRAALGFLGLSPTYWKELKLAPDVIRTVVAEEWEERIGTFSAAFLGLTVACARCHDHKYDPITTQDYYALAGVFASLRQVDRTLLPEPEAQQIEQARAQLKALEDRIGALRMEPKPPADRDQQIAAAETEAARVRQMVRLDITSVPAVMDAALVVLPDGEHRTRLDWRTGAPQNVAVQRRGNPTSMGPIVPRRFLAVLGSGEPAPFREGSGRLELARAVVREGGPLAARVLVNRVWKHHFGAGLVETPSDFGTQGSRPSHPELLDDLATRFVAGGWSLRWLHREIVLSAAYRQSSAHDAAKAAADPDNRWLWRMNRRRLEVEAWRDAMLAANGTLDRTVGGRSRELADPGNVRRTLYGTIRRRELTDLLRLYDFPDPITHSPGRIPTTTPLQQLFVLNSPFLQQQAEALSRRLAGEVPEGAEDRIRRAYALLFGRSPREKEFQLGLAFLEQGQPDQAWRSYAQALLASNEFLFVD